MKCKGFLENSKNKERLGFDRAQSVFRVLKCRVLVCLHVCAVMFICEKWAKGQNMGEINFKSITYNYIEEGLEF